MKTTEKPRIGLLLIGAGRFRPLGEGTADGTYESRKNEEAGRIIRAFSPFAHVIFGSILYDKEDVENNLNLFIREKADCVCAVFLSWAEDFTWIRFLRDMPAIPLFFASIVRDELHITDTNDENQFVDFLSAGALVGAQVASGSLSRFDKPMTRRFIGTLDETAKELAAFSKAAMVRNALRRSTVSLLACYNEAMWATYCDPYNIFMKVGPELKFLSVTELLNEREKIDDAYVEELCQKFTTDFEVYPNVRYDLLKQSVKASVAMENIAEKVGTDLLVLNDVDSVLLNHVGLRPGFAPTTPEKADMVIVPEGDIGGGLATYILHLLTGRAANFIEPFYIDRKRQVVVAGHAGPNNFRECPENMIIARDERFAKSAYPYAGAPFAWYTIPEGEKTLLHMSEKDGRMKIVACNVDAVRCPHYLASYSHGEFTHRTQTPEQLFNRILNIGVTQHYGIAPGNCMKELQILAELCGFDFTDVN